MLYLIAEHLGFPGVLNLIRYISFRAGAASFTALAIGLMLGPWFISYLRVRQGNGAAVLAAGIDDRLPAECIRIPAGRPETAALGAMSGTVTAERVPVQQKVVV